MNDANKYARRYHWLGEKVNDFVNEPHSAICCDKKKTALNLVAEESEEAREVTALLSREKPNLLVKELKKIQTLELPAHHLVRVEDINPNRIEKIFLKTYERQPENFKTLLAMPGVGPKTIRALSLISELVYGVKPSFKDPVRYSFTHGGKDGYPYPVDKVTYDKSIEILRAAISHAKIGREEKLYAFKRLANHSAAAAIQER